MSELKAQLLGIILTITLFGVVSGVLTGAFEKYKTKINNEVSEIVSPTQSLGN